VNIQVFVTPGCENGPRAADLVADVVRETAPGSAVEIVVVPSAEDAMRFALPGFPTVRVNGIDIDPEAPTTTTFG
jgi:hypothetical protein